MFYKYNSLFMFYADDMNPNMDNSTTDKTIFFILSIFLKYLTSVH
jgi:hypothetical protein